MIDIIHQGSDLYLVFEFQDRDLKKHMDLLRERGIQALAPNVVKVSYSLDISNYISPSSHIANNYYLEFSIAILTE